MFGEISILNELLQKRQTERWRTYGQLCLCELSIQKRRKRQPSRPNPKARVPLTAALPSPASLFQLWTSSNALCSSLSALSLSNRIS